MRCLVIFASALALASAVHAGQSSAQGSQPTELTAAEQQPLRETLTDAQQIAGFRVFTKWCAPCHGPDRTYPGTNALFAKYRGERPAVLNRRTDLTPELVGYFVRHGFSAMPRFRKTEISDGELRALGTYLTRHHRAAR